MLESSLFTNRTARPCAEISAAWCTLQQPNLYSWVERESLPYCTTSLWDFGVCTASADSTSSALSYDDMHHDVTVVDSVDSLYYARLPSTVPTIIFLLEGPNFRSSSSTRTRTRTVHQSRAAWHSSRCQSLLYRAPSHRIARQSHADVRSTKITKCRSLFCMQATALQYNITKSSSIGFQYNAKPEPEWISDE
jgi:hypothetical protein